MHPRARELIEMLGLEPHREGGVFRQTFRSQRLVAPNDSRGPRSALTVIYFLLVGRGISRWHRVVSDEAWHWYEGVPVELFTAPARGGAIETGMLGPVSAVAMPQRVVPAGSWQAARCSGDYALVGCSVGPGFEYADFALLAELSEAERPQLLPAALASELL